MTQHHTYGAPESDELGPLGGGAGYTKLVTEPDYLVHGIEELRVALKDATTGQVVYVPHGVEIDMTVWVRACDEKLVMPCGVTLAGSRGVDGSPGGLIYSDEFATQPLIEVGEGVRVTGLRIGGPDCKVRHDETMTLYHNPDVTHDGGGYYSFPVSTGVETKSPGLVVDNCELWGWSNAAIATKPGASSVRRSTAKQAHFVGLHVHHCDIHHCQHAGLGYGVLPHGADALIEMNRFDYMRHAIAGSGIPGTAYEARYNVHGAHSTSHCFDMHGSEENNVTVDGRSIAGEWIRIHHNTFMAPDMAAIGIRALPRNTCEIHHNWFHTDEPVKLYGDDAESNPDAFGVRDNVIGTERTPWEFGAV
jgi:hypothetical protein